MDSAPRLIARWSHRARAGSRVPRLARAQAERSDAQAQEGLEDGAAAQEQRATPSTHLGSRRGTQQCSLRTGSGSHRLHGAQARQRRGEREKGGGGPRGGGQERRREGDREVRTTARKRGRAHQALGAENEPPSRTRPPSPHFRYTTRLPSPDFPRSRRTAQATRWLSCLHPVSHLLLTAAARITCAAQVFSRHALRALRRPCQQRSVCGGAVVSASLGTRPQHGRAASQRSGCMARGGGRTAGAACSLRRLASRHLPRRPYLCGRRRCCLGSAPAHAWRAPKRGRTCGAAGRSPYVLPEGCGIDSRPWRTTRPARPSTHLWLRNSSPLRRSCIPPRLPPVTAGKLRHRSHTPSTHRAAISS